MDKVSKFLKRLTREELKTLEDILQNVRNGSLVHLDVKKLKGASGLFRVRKGSVRVIFRKEQNIIQVLSIDRRDENTYKNL